MSSFNLIEKVKYSKPQDGVVSVKEYILFSDEHNDDKYVVFKLYNHLNQRLSYVSYEVLEYDSENKIVEKTIFEYTGFNARAQECFVPKAKLKLNGRCTNICCKLIKADFETIYWENGNFIKKPESFEKYRDDKKEGKGPEIKKPKKVTPEKKKKEKKKYYAKDVMKRNIHPFPKKFTIITAVATIIFFVITILLINQSDDLYYGGISYKRLDKENIQVVGVEEGVTNINIVHDINGVPVTSIVAEAFVSSSIESVNIEADSIKIGNNAFKDCLSLEDITAKEISSIGRGAFSGCVSLTFVDLEGALSVGSNAFENCLNLSIVNLPNADISENAFVGCTSVNSFAFGTTSSVRFGNMFGLANDEMYDSLSDITTNQEHITSYFYDELSNISSFKMINPNVYIESGALDSLNVRGYTEFDYYAVLNGTMIYLEEGLTSLEINSGVERIPAGLLNTKGRYLRSISISNCNITLTKEHFTSLSYLQTLKLDTKVKLESGALEKVISLNELTIGCDDLSLEEIIGSNKINKINIVGSIPSYFFKNVYLKEVNISRNSTVSAGAFNDVLNIDKLSVRLSSDQVAYLSNNNLPGLDELTLLGETKMNQGLFENISGLKKLTIEHAIANYEGGVLSDLTELEYLNIKWDYINYSHLGQLFYSGSVSNGDYSAYVPETLNYVVYSADVSYANFFNNCDDIRTIIFDNIAQIDMKLDSASNLTNIYFANSVSEITESTIASIIELAKSHRVNIYFEGTSMINIINDKVKINENVDFSSFRIK